MAEREKRNDSTSRTDELIRETLSSETLDRVFRAVCSRETRYVSKSRKFDVRCDMPAEVSILWESRAQTRIDKKREREGEREN